MNKKLNIVMVSEVCPQTGAASLPDSETFTYGAGAILFEIMNSVAERLRDEDVAFDEVKLLFFKTKYAWVKKQSSGDDYCNLFHQYMVEDFANRNYAYIESVPERLCTVRTLNEALTRIYRESGSLSVLVFTSYRKNIFADENPADLLLTAENRPDLSLFFLNGVSAGEVALLSRFNTEQDHAHIFSFDSVEADTDYFYRRLTENRTIKNAVGRSIDTRRGLAYIIYGLLKSTLKVNHSFAFTAEDA